MFTSCMRWNVTGSGDVDQHAPKVSGCVRASQSVDHPPDEWPRRRRAADLGSRRYFCSSDGISYSTNALARVPMMAESAKRWWSFSDSGSSTIQKVLAARAYAAEPVVHRWREAAILLA